MNAADDRMAELDTVWDERGIRETELQIDSKGTIVPRQAVVGPASWVSWMQELPTSSGDRVPLVELGDELGRGGMGVVRAGEQRCLGREVAVKSPLAPDDAAATQALLREAWLCGQLEHPNVVPVHALYRREEAPLLLMKRVEGVDWSVALGDGGGMERHLRTLIQVCHAVHFAHTRGIIHLDLKPSNVMLGSYGEIYLLDWGIAVCDRDDLPSLIPRARDITGVRGTPAYMAPELAAGDGDEIDARTDVYLLGSMLHEILTGRPPHEAPTLMESVRSAFASASPRFDDEVPSELGAICARALERDPDDRYPDASALREALEEYLVHSDSIQLSVAAHERWLRVVEALEGPGGEGSERVDGLAGEAEFGFRQALHVWPGNEAAKTALQDLLERLVVRDLDDGNWSAAMRRLPNLPVPRPDLEWRATEAQKRSSAKEEQLARLQHDHDLGMYSDARSKMAYLGAILWGGSLLTVGLLRDFGVFEPDHGSLLGVTLGGTLVFAAIVYTFRRQVFANQVNRNIIALLTVGFLMGDLYWIGMVVTDPPFEAAAIGIGPISVFVIAGHAASLDRRLVLHTIVAVAGISLTFFSPKHALELIGATGIVVLVMLARTWSKPEDEA